MKHIFFLLLLAAMLLPSCKKEDTTPDVDLSFLEGKRWVNEKDSDEKLRFNFKSSVREAIPSNDPIVLQPVPQEVGNIEWWFTRTYQVPALPDINRKEKEQGDSELLYAHEENGRIYLSGETDFNKAWTYLNGNLSSLGNSSGVKSLEIRYDISTKELLYNNQSFKPE